MSIDDRRTKNTNQQRTTLKQRREETREKLKQQADLIYYDRWSGKWYALNPADGTILLEKAYNTKSAVLKVVNTTALGKNLARPVTEPQAEKRPSDPIGYKKGQVFKFPKPQPKKQQYPIKYLYSVVEKGLRNYYIGGFQDKPVQLPKFPFVPTRFFLQNTGKTGFVLGVANSGKVGYYQNFSLIYETSQLQDLSIFKTPEYLGFGFWQNLNTFANTNSVDQGDAYSRIETKTNKVYDLLSDLGELSRLVSFFSESLRLVIGRMIPIGGTSFNGVATTENTGSNFNDYFNTFTTVNTLISKANNGTVETGGGNFYTANNIRNSFENFFKPLCVLSKSQTVFGYYIESTISNFSNGVIPGEPTGINSIKGFISKGFVQDGNLIVGEKEEYFYTAASIGGVSPGYREDYWVTTELYKELTDPELKFECFEKTFSSVEVSESIEDSIAAGNLQAVWQIKTYDAQFQLVEDAFYNAWLPHVQSGFTVHSTSYHPQQ